MKEERRVCLVLVGEWAVGTGREWVGKYVRRICRVDVRGFGAWKDGMGIVRWGIKRGGAWKGSDSGRGVVYCLGRREGKMLGSDGAGNVLVCSI